MQNTHKLQKTDYYWNLKWTKQYNSLLKYEENAQRSETY